MTTKYYGLDSSHRKQWRGVMRVQRDDDGDISNLSYWNRETGDWQTDFTLMDYFVGEDSGFGEITAAEADELIASFQRG